jgi:hypothetical protein
LFYKFVSKTIYSTRKQTKHAGRSLETFLAPKEKGGDSMNKKRSLILVLVTFCLTLILFTIIPTFSSPGVGDYNPWLDINGDGVVDGGDIIQAARAFGTSGDPTRPVNVTSVPARSIEEDLNITISDVLPWGSGSNSTNVFQTEGYDRVFVYAAIIDISDHRSPLSTSVYLDGANWYWGTVNGAYMKTYDPVDYNKQVKISVWNTSDIPISCGNCSEFSVKAAQCSLLFDASSDIHRGWVLIRVSVYLTVGTNSPPSVQNVYVTNTPYIQPQPSYANRGSDLNMSITNGYGGASASVYTGGYSRMFVSIEVINASYQGIPSPTTISMYGINWYSYIDYSSYSGSESVPQGTLNVTYNGVNLPAWSQQVPAEFKSKNAYCTLNFNVNSQVVLGWLEFVVNVYLRNE